jgi:3',5'-cyclic AMP phosphodiesterase CpdA
MKIAIIADTHINPKDDTSTSVYRVHANANRRVLAVIEKINTLGVDLAVHLGDFVRRIQGQPLRAEAIHGSARDHEHNPCASASRARQSRRRREGYALGAWAPCNRGHPPAVQSGLRTGLLL